jgi:peptidoglycan hydrolase-like protein with peptidoglycan-binding domain
MQFVAIDGCPVPAALSQELLEIKRRTGVVYVSVYRGTDPNGVRILRQFGKKSQAELYDGWIHRRPGFNPANRPGQSTHELRNDGVAYFGPVGMPLRYWMVGIDCSNAAGVVQAAKALGFTATVTYPNSTRERHHVNFRKEPRFRAFRVLQYSDSGRRVRKLRRQLHFVLSPVSRKPYTTKHRAKGKDTFFDRDLEMALTRFQREHHQKADGIYGIQTHRQLQASVRFRKRANH